MEREMRLLVCICTVALLIAIVPFGSAKDQLSTREYEDLGFSGLALCSDCNAFAEYVKEQDEVKSKRPKITYADLYQLAGVIAVEVTGGPTIDFVPGRKDSSVSPKEGRLPDAKQGRHTKWSMHSNKCSNQCRKTTRFITNCAPVPIRDTDWYLTTRPHFSKSYSSRLSTSSFGRCSCYKYNSRELEA